VRSSVKKTVEPIKMPFGLWARMGTWNHVLNPPWEGAILCERGAHSKFRDTMRSRVRKRLNRSSCLWIVISDRPKESRMRCDPDPQ